MMLPALRGVLATLSCGLVLWLATVVGSQAWLVQGGSAYSGPIDATTTAESCNSLRACSEAVALAGTAIVNLRRSTDNETCDFGTNRNGFLGLSKNCSGSDNGETATTFENGGSLFETDRYDQTGNGYNMANSTAATQAAFTISCLNGLPCDVFTYATSQFLVSSSFATLAQQYTFGAVAERTSNTTSYQKILASDSGTDATLGFNDTANTVFMYGGAVVATASATDSALHTFSAVFNGSSSIMNVDGTETTGLNTGTDSTGTNIAISENLSGQPLGGKTGEQIIWASGLSSTNRTNYCHNARLAFGSGGSC